jgi:alanine racemase
VAMVEAAVDLGALTHNAAVLVSAAAASGAATMAVVKADGFGHGLVPSARAAVAGGASWLGVTSVTEALEVRAAGLSTPTLAWLFTPDDDLAALAALDVDVSVSSLAHLDAVAACGQFVTVQLKVDTGLTRNGVSTRDWADLVTRARRHEQDGTLRVRGIWSHLAAADDPGNPSVDAQLAAFDTALAAAGRAGLDPELRHLANSAAILDLPKTHFDLVRAGIALYGVEPMPGLRSGLRRAMTLRARAINVKRVPPGTGVSYMHEYATRAETTVVLVPLGYADGVPRVTGNRAQVWIGGARYTISGRVAMDQFVVDVGDLPVAIGDEVVLFGPGDGGEPVVEEWARWAGTNAHEILTGIGRRVPRTYGTEGTPVTTV